MKKEKILTMTLITVHHFYFFLLYHTNNFLSIIYEKMCKFYSYMYRIF